MRSKLFVISDEEKGYIPDFSKHDVFPGCDWIDYSVFRERDLEELMEVLPKGCFKLEDSKITILNKPTEYLEKFLEEVKLTFNLLTPKDMGNVEYYKALRKARVNDIDYRIYSDNFNCSVPLINWLMEEVMSKEVGHVFYVRSVVEFHF